MSFVHLHVHSEYSLLEASNRVKQLAKKTAEYGMPAVALTDLGCMFGAIEFYFACMDAKVKPILGLEVYLAPNSRFQKGVATGGSAEDQGPPNRLVLLAENIEGYRTLCRISTAGYFEGKYYVPRVDYEVLSRENQNLICLSGGFRGDVVSKFLKQGPDAAKESINKLKNIFGDRFYLELTRLGLPRWQEVDSFLQQSARDLDIKTVAANDVFFMSQDDKVIQEVLVCIGANRTLHDDSRPKLGSDQFYFKKPEQMRELFKDVPEACDRTLEIADRCNVKFKLKDDKGKPIYHLPSYPTREGATLKDEIELQSFDGLKQRFEEFKKTEVDFDPHQAWPAYEERIKYELSIIDRMGFNGYFLIVADFINWAKTNDIPVGPGRGSGAGSLVAYSLKITDLDPVKYKLLFERFLNPERISMPDFDIDFCQDRRVEVINYVTQKYGEKSVSQIITYGKLQAKAAIKDVGRVLGMTFSEVDVVSKLVPERPGITIDNALQEEPRLRELMDTDSQTQSLIGLAQRVEGLVRHAGIHAAGVIIADGELVSHAPLYLGAGGENVVQYDMKHAEKIGLIKFDFLGLKTLTLINHALKLIEQNRGIKIIASDISLTDPGIYEIMSSGDTLGIFQFEGEGITDAIRKIKPTNFFDITAINALYRPGPMAMIPEFAKRKNKEEPVTYLFDELKEILEETYGIIVYQEQVMGIASLIAGYSLGEADMLRRAMGKKIKEEMDQHRVRFLKGAGEKGFEAKKSEELFELMYKFADYGFNKSHAAAYCVVAAQTAWLKRYYPVEFFAALLSTELSDTERIVRYVKDVQKRGIKVKPPHVNYSDFLFSVKGEEIYFGLGGIKGVGEQAVIAILEGRKAAEFSSLENFFEMVDSRKLNKKVMECLIKAGAFDGFGYHRAQILAGYSRFLERANENRQDRETGQTSLFELSAGSSEDGDSGLEDRVTLDEVKQWTKSMTLSQEKDVLGFYLSDHPLSVFKNSMLRFVSGEIENLPRIHQIHQEQMVVNKDKQKYDFRNRDGNKKKVTLLCVISELRELLTKKGTRMAFARIEDLSGTCELVVFPDAFSNFEALLKMEAPLMVTGFLECENGVPKLILEKCETVETTLRTVKRLIINLNKIEIEDISKLKSIFDSKQGATRIEFIAEMSDLKKMVSLVADDPQGVSINEQLIEDLQQGFGGMDFVQLM